MAQKRAVRHPQSLTHPSSNRSPTLRQPPVQHLPATARLSSGPARGAQACLALPPE
ncbi:hypothetical protein DM02DRAFT_610351 [Periconia macrospinosa]|uniref:Uncharacterized protein n=1 Tax=Periconia macrospinosa TaxID=97972 RepID=A0A2V1E9L5_9PLEO|nr:hypothetical protein DM02DRAFT_610351 [Periconia macrospinosa]